MVEVVVLVGVGRTFPLRLTSPRLVLQRRISPRPVCR